MCGISSLGIDHTQILGDTIEKIAWQKGGIFKVGWLYTSVMWYYDVWICNFVLKKTSQQHCLAALWYCFFLNSSGLVAKIIYAQF